jgi:hypothetical protein
MPRKRDLEEDETEKKNAKKKSKSCTADIEIAGGPEL